MEIWRGMKSTKPAGCQWNKILILVLSSLVFFKHIIDHATYTLQTNSTNDVLIVGCSTDDFLCAYFSIHLFRDFLAGIKNEFPVTSTESPELSYLNLQIIQSWYGIIIYQTYHIQDNISAQCFPYASEKFNSSPTPFNTYITFELSLEETLPATSDELHILEESYLGKFSAHIGKISILCNTRTLISCML